MRIYRGFVGIIWGLYRDFIGIIKGFIGII